VKPISDAALNVLSVLDVDTVARTAKITAGQLPRPLYVEVNKALEALGGKWNRKVAAHVFDEPTFADDLESALLAGTFTDKRKALGFFETPPALARRLVEAAGIEPGAVQAILEPSAGRGAIIDAIPGWPAGPRGKAGKWGIVVVASEVDPKNAKTLIGTLEAQAKRGLLVSVYEHDFLSARPENMAWPYTWPDRLPLGSFDAVVMNPPFARQADIDHVTHAFSFLRSGGRLAAIMSAGTAFRENRKAVEFRDLVRKHAGTISSLPDGSFEPATGVRTVLVTMVRG